MRRRALVVIVGTSLVGACNALTGASDLVIDDTAIPGPIDAATETGTGPGPRDGSTDGTTTDGASPDAGPRPSYCEGITLYLRFDDTPKSAQGDSPAIPTAVTYGAGKFKTAVDFNSQKTLVFAAAVGSTRRYDINIGTLSLWFKPRWQLGTNTATRTFMRPQDTADAATGSVPNLRLDSAAKTLGVEGPTNVEATAPLTSLLATWKDLDWNHLVGTWQRSGAPETLSFTLNGGGGDAGPGRVSTNTAWTPPVAGTFMRLNSTSDIDGFVDDVTVWSRVLGKDEVTRMHADGMAGRAVGDTCGLP